MDQTHESKPEILRKQLTVAVRSIQWSYAIFWSLSSTQPGVLEWEDGYYNGDIKTRKTVQSEDCKGDKIGLKRSEQLRELYTSLMEAEAGAEAEADQEHAKAPSDALSPEDLSDAEWYYLVCMSFVFNHAEGLPGRALATCQTIWLCNAQHADSKVFSRSLLAKSASIQTVVCFPYLGGVIELGVTEMVSEDTNLLQHVKASLLKLSKPVCVEKSSSINYKTDNDKEPMHGRKGCDSEEWRIDSSKECSNGFNRNHDREDSFILECVNGGASQVQSGQLLDDEFSNGIEVSLNSNDCISQGKPLFPPMAESVNHAKSSSSRLEENEDIHYKRTLFTVLGNSSRSIGNLTFRHSIRESSFSKWKGDLAMTHKPLTHQKLLKKIFLTLSLIPITHSLKQKNTSTSDCLWTATRNIVCEKTRENEQFMVLKSMVPSISETNKTLILNDTIKYLEALEARVQELEDCMECVDHDEEDQSMSNIEYNKEPWVNKRKPYDIVDTNDLPQEGKKLGVKVSVKGLEVLIDMQCPYREYILLDIIDAIYNLKLDVHFVQSSSLDGTLTLLLKSKVRGQEVAPVWLIKHALWTIANK